MAIGDLDGDLQSTYKARDPRRQASLNSLPAGPVGRASQQLTSLSAAPIATQPVQPIAQPASLGEIPVVSAQNPFRQTGIGGSAQGGQIVGRQAGASSPEFTNFAGAQQQAAGLGSIQPAPSPQTPSQGAQTLASLGDFGNIGNGIGTFSQSQQGDAALAAGRFQRAADIRQDTRNQQRLDRALANQASLDNFTVVRDSSRPLTRDDLVRDAQAQQDRQNGLETIGMAQGMISGTQAARSGAQQLRQAARLEDLQSRAYSPMATDQDRAALTQAMDPTGEKRAAVGLAQARADQATAAAAKDRAEASGESPKAQQEATLRQLDIDKRQTEAAQKALDTTEQKTKSIDIAKEARDLAASISADQSFGSITGPINARTPTLSGSSQDLVNKAGRLQSLLTLDNLKLMTGVLTDKDIEFLGRIGSGLNITENGIKGSEAGTRARLNDISTKLGEKIGAYEKSNPAAAQTSPAGAQASAIPRVTTKAQADALPAGSTFIGPDGRQYRK